MNIEIPTFKNAAVTIGVTAIVAALETVSVPGPLAGEAYAVAQSFAAIVRRLELLGV
jgi:hypothetical protein